MPYLMSGHYINWPSIEDTPAKCKLKITKSTELFKWPVVAKGGYKVHPVPAPWSNKDKHNNKNAEGNNQKLTLFNRGKAISGAPTITGTINFQNHRSYWHYKKKNHNQPWAVITVL